MRTVKLCVDKLIKVEKSFPQRAYCKPPGGLLFWVVSIETWNMVKDTGLPTIEGPTIQVWVSVLHLIVDTSHRCRLQAHALWNQQK